MQKPMRFRTEELEYVAYKDLRLKLGREENVFERLAREDGDGMRVMGSRLPPTNKK